MLTKPDLPDDQIVACLHESFGLRGVQASFLPIGADVNSAVYRVTTDDGTPYFLKLRRGNFDELAVAVPAFVHERGILHVMAPLPTTTGQLWVHAHGFDWMLYPFFEGKNGYEAPLSQAQWIAFGAAMKAIHTTTLPADLAARVPRETYSPRWRRLVQAYHEEVEERVYDNPIAARFAAFWTTKRDEIQSIVERAEQLARTLRQRTVELVLCHADLHGGNVLAGAGDALTIVDWDEIILAPKERDLMSVGGGLFGNWNQDLEDVWFYEGYGDSVIDPVALTYYRYERIVADIAVYATQILGLHGSAEDRELGLRQWTGQFLPNEVVEVAHSTYAQL